MGLLNRKQWWARRAFGNRGRIETFRIMIPFSRLGSRLWKPQSLYRDWDRDFQYANPFFETGIETFKMSIPFSRLWSRLINGGGSLWLRLSGGSRAHLWSPSVRHHPGRRQRSAWFHDDPWCPGRKSSPYRRYQCTHGGDTWTHRRDTSWARAWMLRRKDSWLDHLLFGGDRRNWLLQMPWQLYLPLKEPKGRQPILLQDRHTPGLLYRCHRHTNRQAHTAHKASDPTSNPSSNQPSNPTSNLSSNQPRYDDEKQ